MADPQQVEKIKETAEHIEKEMAQTEAEARKVADEERAQQQQDSEGIPGLTP